MTDRQIVDLYWVPSENALSETTDKYGTYCHYIAYHILHNQEDSEECVNDTYLKAWNCMSPQRPEKLSTFLGKLTRNLSLHRYEKLTARNRGAGQAQTLCAALLVSHVHRRNCSKLPYQPK